MFCKETFGERFKKNDVKNIWKDIAGNRTDVNQNYFSQVFSKYNGWEKQKNAIDEEFPKDDWQYEDYNIIQGTTMRS